MISAVDYAFLGRLLRETTGLAIGDGKEYLLESRLVPIALTLGLPDVGSVVARLRSSPSADLVRAVCEAMATYESSFFRDGAPFDLIRQRLVPELMQRRAANRTMRIWCAAASTGQEPYSVAMALADLPLDGWNVEILATDYSRVALGRARSGIYNTFEIQRGMRSELRQRFCTQVGIDWRIDDSIRQRVSFAEVNLLHPFSHLGSFDLILCRNVLIYFDVDTRKDVLDRMAGALSPDGYLLLGAAESAIGVTEGFARVPEHPTSVYRRVSRPAVSLVG
jgi:chemotaxis protein methyltransferase CheR